MHTDTHDAKVNEIYENIEQLMEFVKSQGRGCRETPIGGRRTERYDEDETERGVFKRILEVGRLAMEAYVEEVGSGDEGKRMVRDDIEYRRRAYNAVTLLTVFGEVPVPRYGYSAEGHAYIYPTDWRMNLPERNWSYFVQQINDRFSLEETYEKSVDIFNDLFGISVSTRTADSVIAETSQYHREFAGEVEVPKAPDGTIQVVSFDGKGVPMRKLPHERQPCGLALMSPELANSKSKSKNKKEALVGLEYTVFPHERKATDIVQGLLDPEALTEEQRDRLHGRERGTAPYYQASVAESKEELMKEIRERVDRRPGSSKYDLVCLIDGSPHLCGVAERVFPDADIVLDLIHVTQYLWGAANALFPDSMSDSKELVRSYLTTILQGRVGHVIGGLKQRLVAHGLKGNRKKEVEKAIGYFDRHRQYMHYKKYLSRGSPITTGVVESACGHLVMDRMEKAGARWNLDGAEAMLRLRSIYKSGNWKEYLQYRKQQEALRIYPEFSSKAA